MNQEIHLGNNLSKLVPTTPAILDNFEVRDIVRHLLNRAQYNVSTAFFPTCAEMKLDRVIQALGDKDRCCACCQLILQWANSPKGSDLSRVSKTLSNFRSQIPKQMGMHGIHIRKQCGIRIVGF